MREYRNKLSLEQKFWIFIGFSFLVSIYTYGHAYKHYECDRSYCGAKGFDSFIDGVFWPYYWSKEIQK